MIRRFLLCLAAAGITGLPAATKNDGADKISPPTLTLKENTETRITCEYRGEGGAAKYSGVYHYKIWIPQGYAADPKKNWKSLFIASPGGNANMGFMARWIKTHGYIAIMLEESKNGPWDPTVGNFLAAHNDALKRVRLMPYGKVCTGFSGGARASSIFVTIAPGFGGIILQGAGVGVLDNGIYGLRGIQLPAVAMTMGTKDSNRPEIAKLRETLEDRLEVFDFVGGHAWAPQETIEKALDFVDSCLPK
ncbi:MAG: hypothetical protein EBU04_06030 [Verrucomicrobia bacterium]|jgi:hypothetical protein|nr:hypothetical protein [Verrucomicrobiota bacterium]NBS04357.1 hypothetical protein [Verrucomicrobiota bacterium]NBY36835.1 hypothetical protein [Verrucomicrobiota bacterium]